MELHKNWRNGMKIVNVFIIVLNFLFFVDTAVCIDAAEIIKNVKHKYEEIESFSADFKQVFKWKLAAETQEHQGKIILQGADKFRIETSDQLIISDGTTIWTYSKINNQVIIDAIGKANDVILPREIFLKFSKEYNEKLQGEERITNSDCYIVHLIAKNEDIFIKEMKIWIDKKAWLTLKIEHIDINNNLTVYSLDNIITNKKIAAEEFVYKIPPGIEVIDMR